MNYQLFAIIFGVIVAVNGFAIPLGENVNVQDSDAKDSTAEYSHADQPAEDPQQQVLPLESQQKEDSSTQESQNEDLLVQKPQSEDSPAVDQPAQDSQSEPAQESQSESAQESQSEPAQKLENEDSSEQESQEEDSSAQKSQEDSSAQKSQEDSSAQESQEKESSAQKSQEKESSAQESISASLPEVNQSSDVHTGNSLAEELPEEDLFGEDSETYINEEAMGAVTLGLNQFSTEFYKKTAATRPRNLVCSPLSVGVVLAMTAQGARGLTEQEMYRALHLPVDSLVSKHGYQSLIDSLNDDYKKVNLHLANTVFVTDELQLNNEYENAMETYYRSPVQKVAFQYPDEASDHINYWVEEQTDGNIKNIINSADAFDALMVLVNAVYFKGAWKSKFQHENTMLRAFHIDKRHFKLVPTMYQKNTFNYGNLPGLNSVFIELPYESFDESDAMSMFVILPKEETNLKKVVNASEKIDFQKLHSHPRMTPVKLYMPKFKVRSTLNLQPVLEKMGMHEMFTDRANFTGMVKDDSLKVSKVVQKAFIEVNEEGSEAAAASAVELNLKTSAGEEEPKPVEMYVDRPFMYAIYHRGTNTVIFQGYVRVPALK